MKKKYRFYLFFVLFCLYAYCCQAQIQLTKNVLKSDTTFLAEKTTIRTFEMLVGHWHGDGLGGKTDELWLPPAGQQMHGVFRLVKENQLVFSEYMLLQEDENARWALKVKHFSEQGKAWEKAQDWVDFSYIKVEANKLYFSGLTFEKINKNTLKIYIAFKDERGQFKEETFDLKRKKM